MSLEILLKKYTQITFEKVIAMCLNRDILDCQFYFFNFEEKKGATTLSNKNIIYRFLEDRGLSKEILKRSIQLN